MHIYPFLYIHIYTYIYIYLYIYTCMCMYIYIYIHVCVCICIYNLGCFSAAGSRSGCVSSHPGLREVVELLGQQEAGALDWVAITHHGAVSTVGGAEGIRAVNVGQLGERGSELLHLLWISLHLVPIGVLALALLLNVVARVLEQNDGARLRVSACSLYRSPEKQSIYNLHRKVARSLIHTRFTLEARKSVVLSLEARVLNFLADHVVHQLHRHSQLLLDHLGVSPKILAG